MIERCAMLAMGLLLLYGCSEDEIPVDTTDYSAALYGKWQVTSGGDELKYVLLQPERTMYLLGEDIRGLRGVVKGTFAADADLISLGGRFFYYARSTDQLSLVNSVDTISLVLNPAAPEHTQWVRPIAPTDSIPAPVNQGTDIATDSTSLWMGSGLAGNPVLYRINIASRVVTQIVPPLLVTATEWDGGGLWCSGSFTNQLMRIDPVSGAILASSVAVGTNIFGLAWDGQHLWAGSQSARALSVYDPQTNAVVQTYSEIYGDGMAFAGGFLYLCKDGAIHKCTTSPFRGVTSFSIPGARATGIAYDGVAFWVSAATGPGPQYVYKIYRVVL